MIESKIEQSQNQALTLALGLPIELTAVLDAESDRAYHQLLSGNKYPLAAHEYLMQNMAWYFGFGLGAYAAFTSNMPLLGCIILVNWWVVVKHHWLVGAANFRPGVHGRSTLEVKIVVSEDGFAETDRMVASHFGWNAMNQWYFWRSILFIQLKNNTYAIVPQKGLQPSDFNLEQLCSLLKIKGVPGMRLKDD